MNRIFKQRKQEQDFEQERSTEAFLNALSHQDYGHEKSLSIHQLEHEIKKNGFTPEIEKQLEKRFDQMPSVAESLILQNIEHNEFKSLSELSRHSLMKRFNDDHFRNLAQKGWIYQPNDNEMNFLNEIAGQDSRDKKLFLQVQSKWGIKNRDLEKLQLKGHLNLPNEQEIKAYNMIQNKIPSLFIQYTTKISEGYQEVLKKMNKDQFYQIKCKSKLVAHNPLPENIKNWKLKRDQEEFQKLYSPLPNDNEILIKSILKETDNFFPKDKKRERELKSMGITLEKVHIPPTKDLKFFDQINHKKLTKEQIYKIGKDDFGIDKDHIDTLIDHHKYIKITPEKVKINWKDPTKLTEIRSYYHTKKQLKGKDPEKVLHSLFPFSVNQKVLNKIQETESQSDFIPLKRNRKDIRIFFKNLREEDLDKFENFRLNQLKREGIHPEHKMSQNYFLQEKNSWQLASELKKQRILTYEKKYGVNKDALKMINTFKQIAHHTLLEMGLNEEELSRYTKGLTKNKPLGQCKLLSKQVLETPKGPIPYYFLQHEGHVSGRRILEPEIGKNNINKYPQKNQKFLFHDLKVVDSFLKVQKEIEDAGGKISQIKNESRQFSESKKGLQNNQRNNSLHFLDAQIILEEPIELPYQDKKISVKTIGVEYGNYPTERMREKLEKGQYDIAFVYSNKRHQIKYQNKIHINRPVHFRSI